MESEMDEKTGAVTLELDVLPVISFILQQNGARLLRSVTVVNDTREALENVELKIAAGPAFALPFTRHLDYIPAGKTFRLEGPEVILSGEFLAGTTEKLTGLLRAELCRGEEVLASCHGEVSVLAYDEWHGLALYPELLAGFVTPNHPQVGRILSRATEFLGRWTGDTSLDGYQSQDPNRVLSQAGAIFAAIREQSIAYAQPPASFERMGQRVRLVDMVLRQKLGTCLDLSLLYVSCLEAAGLHPLLIAQEGHIFAGVWTEDRMFPEAVQDDASLITKRLAPGVNEMAVVEATFLTSGVNADFDSARDQGAVNLSKGVECIVDVCRARLSGVSPLPQRIPGENGWKIQETSAPARKSPAAPQKLGQTIAVEDQEKQEDIPKKLQWERKLLDLGLRNTLINLRLTKTQLPILASSLDDLEDALSDGSDFTILPRPAEWRMEEPSFEAMTRLGEAELICSEFQNKRLRAACTEAELTKTVKGLYRAAKTALEENGANTLYLALGMLRWYENKRSTKARYAPVILVPVELVRKSAARGYVLRLRDDEPQMNITILEKLKQDFGIQVNGLDPLPMDEHGVDIRRVLTVVRKAVMDQPRWDVVEGASIGIFSFSQFVMWNDIRNRTADLMENKVVRSLMEGKLCWDAKPLEIGDTVEEDGVLLPMPADASQLYAIRAACQGESFVLHGPPGTGKSQTITSLIANALAQGKRVLFVAEKMAALEVVQKRLDAIGIGPFCLELHSNKSKKKDVLEQLRQAAEVAKTATSEQFAVKAEKLAIMRAELDDYARQLHSRQNCGMSLYELIDRYESCAQAPDLPDFSLGFLRSLDAQTMEQQLLTVERLVAAGREAGHPQGHPLSAVGADRYSQNLRSQLAPVTETFREATLRLAPYVSALAQGLGAQEPAGFEDLKQLAETAAHMAPWYGFPQAWTQTENPKTYFAGLLELADHFEKAKALEEKLLTRFTPDILKEDGQALFAEFVGASGKWFLAKKLGLNKLKGRLGVFAKSPLTAEELQGHITDLRDFRQEETAGKALLPTYEADLGEVYDGKTTDWAAVARMAETARIHAQALRDLYGSHKFLRRFCGREELRQPVLEIGEQYAAFGEARAAFDTLLGIQNAPCENWLAGQARLCGSVLAHAGELKEWMSFQSIAHEAEDLGLGTVVERYRAGMSHEDLIPAYQKALYRGLICDAIDAAKTLNTFSGAVFNEKIQQYKRADREWTELSQQEVYCRLAAKVPNFTLEAAHSSELGIVQRFIKSGGRGVSIRKLFDSIPNLLPRLCPCMLMSPISAAQYLDPAQEPFDIVVFDEASQLPTCKAVGVLARGRDAVIVGDPKQMPPTSFFSVNTVDEDNLDVEDLESILDDCLALNMPQAHLLWHYRSRHESLIAFSNSRFYENKLFTFPSVNDRESRVRLVHVDGVFERGKSRTNRAEAEAVIQELKRRCQDPELRKYSVGVVTFNISQQNLIDDLLSEACAQDPELEKWAFGEQEPVFIKNLENVQGDERDVILFSVGYGPDEEGRVYMNFGPLNRDGGWRRLNVAVSRARQEMVVFSTLRPDQMDLSRTKAEGVAALRAFLEYAEGRPLALDDHSAGLYRSSRQGVAASLCRALAEKGYDTDLSVGRSEYRIDVGVVDPEDPEKYVLGIMLDGRSYGAAKTTRDREIAQTGVLSGLGWQILRLWSVDWWDNRDKELDRILKKLEDIRAGRQEPEPEPEPVRLKARPIPAKSAEPLPEAPLYKAASLPLKPISAEEFTEPSHSRDLQRRIQKVLDREAPVSLGLLIKRITASCGLSRAGSRIQGHITALLSAMGLDSTWQDDVLIYWLPGQSPNTYFIYRAAGEGDSRRDIREVPLQEIANAIYTALHQQVSMEKEDLLREAAKLLGYSRVAGQVQSALDLAVQYAEAQRGIALAPNGAYVLTESGTARAEAAKAALAELAGK